MPAVVADHREAAGEGGAVARRDEADRRADVAVEPAAALEQEAAVPLVGQREREADRVVLAVRALVRVDRALDAAMRGQRLLPRRDGARGGPRGRSGDMPRAGDRQARADLGADHALAAPGGRIVLRGARRGGERQRGERRERGGAVAAHQRVTTTLPTCWFDSRNSFAATGPPSVRMRMTLANFTLPVSLVAWAVR